MGFTDVFTHVGDGVKIQAPDGRRVPPVVTGMSLPSDKYPSVSEHMVRIGVFGADDFMHSLFSGQPNRSISTSCAKFSDLRGIRPYCEWSHHQFNFTVDAI